jgi:hypothetical protein
MPSTVAEDRRLRSSYVYSRVDPLTASWVATVGRSGALREGPDFGIDRWGRERGRKGPAHEAAAGVSGKQRPEFREVTSSRALQPYMHAVSRNGV